MGAKGVCPSGHVWERRRGGWVQSSGGSDWLSCPNGCMGLDGRDEAALERQSAVFQLQPLSHWRNLLS